jgi:methylmalonyl-CoA/ethylmalonyl-CoA epimerase
MHAIEKGGGLNHLCYSTGDIEAACRSLRQADMVIVHEPTPAVAFGGRRIAWLVGQDRVLTELVERVDSVDGRAIIEDRCGDHAR